MERKVSIIIPVYNTIQYLEKSICSALSQTYANIEIILIDDGSTDGSENVCDMYSQKYSNILIKHINNSGAGKARNQGILMATGEYIVFLDSDDVLVENAVESLVLRAIESQAHMVMPDRYFCIDEDDNLVGIKFHFNKELCIEEPIDFAMKVMIGAGRGWRTHSLLIKRVAVVENNIIFGEDVVGGEDFLFNLECMKVINKIAFINTSTVYYRKRRNSITAVFHKDYLENIWKLDNAVDIFAKEMNIKHDLKQYKDALVIREVISYISDIYSNKLECSWKNRKNMAKTVIEDKAVQTKMKGNFQYVYFTNKFAVLYYRLMKCCIQCKIYSAILLLASIGGKMR
ncbi:glycosyltransferase involved in cell wall biosynthesis [Lachnotalea glycerini]|uniref:Glycosyltransferase involved in cell wall biosynthesis n=1 Tax=Lachnotalea glycerini TaxID=1763509 RepID=A0A318ESA0_9FIRM|nr:glycosyltransferase family 2 protein [Lachnotalea glycerini]PXV91447.1 glycosyltransferase involved in cell wall biosynthesis [Lachnotalea glycerini]